MTQLPLPWLRAGRIGGWLVFAGLVTPVIADEPRKLPILLFWLFPLVLPYWFAGFAALSLHSASRGRQLSGWAALHTGITFIGAALLPLWLHVCTTLSGATYDRLLLVVFVALLPAAVPLLSRRNAAWRLYRAMWLNAAGCMLFAVSFLSNLVRNGNAPSAFLLGPVVGLIILLATGVSLERRVPAHVVLATCKAPAALPWARLLRR